MRRVSYSMSVSLDGFVQGPDGDFDLPGLSDEVFDIALGGATLAAQAAALDLIDEYHLRVYPVLVGGGLPFFARDERRADLELLESRSFDSGVAYLRYKVSR